VTRGTLIMHVRPVNYLQAMAEVRTSRLRGSRGYTWVRWLPPNIHNTGISWEFFRTRFNSYNWRQYSERSRNKFANNYRGGRLSSWRCGDKLSTTLSIKKAGCVRFDLVHFLLAYLIVTRSNGFKALDWFFSVCMEWFECTLNLNKHKALWNFSENLLLLFTVRRVCWFKR
jgi:hypothetical protein